MTHLASPQMNPFGRVPALVDDKLNLVSLRAAVLTRFGDELNLLVCSHVRMCGYAYLSEPHSPPFGSTTNLACLLACWGSLSPGRSCCTWLRSWTIFLPCKTGQRLPNGSSSVKPLLYAPIGRHRPECNKAGLMRMCQPAWVAMVFDIIAGVGKMCNSSSCHAGCAHCCDFQVSSYASSALIARVLKLRL